MVGAGIAGSTLAAQLTRRGVATTVVERAAAPRSGGGPVDVRGAALPVVDGMGLLPSLRAAATRTTRLTAVDGRGRPIGSIPVQPRGGGLEIPRSDLATLLAGVAGDAEFVHDDTVTGLADGGGGVHVTFERGAPRRFDLVVGADGLHSRVRRLAFGPEERFVTHLGLYIAGVRLDGTAADPSTVLLYNAPGRSVAVHPGTGRESAAFIFRHAALPAFDVPSLLASVYAGLGWRVPELLDAVRDSDDLYADAVCRVRVDSWSRGRIALVGDAASCVSLFGEGSSMAIVGAATLAQALAADPASALQRYERAHRRRLRGTGRGVAVSSHLLVPATRAGLAARDAAFRLGRRWT